VAWKSGSSSYNGTVGRFVAWLFIVNPLKDGTMNTAPGRSPRARAFAQAVVVLFLLSVAARAQAAPVLFTDRGAFDTAVGGGSSLVTFDNPDVVFVGEEFRFSVTYDDLVQFWFDISGLGTVDDNLMLGANYQTGWGNVLEPVYAFGFDVIRESPDVRLYMQDQEFTPSAPQFLGFVSDVPFDANIYWTAYLGEGTPTSIDNLRIKTAVPEPSTLLLGALGCAALGLRRRRAR
jgi:hypothetical protein